MPAYAGFHIVPYSYAATQWGGLDGGDHARAAADAVNAALDADPDDPPYGYARAHGVVLGPWFVRMYDRWGNVVGYARRIRDESPRDLIGAPTLMTEEEN